MGKTLLLFFLLLSLSLAPAMVWSEGIDLVVMVDTSGSMFPVFPDLVDYLLTDLLTNRLRFGDTFHLLTFADTPEVEIAAPVDSKESIERILRRLLLLKPLGSYTDLVAALRFLAPYVRELPEGNRKTILLLTDGIHDPPPDSAFRMDPQEVARQLFQTAQEIARAGWKVHILRLPQDGRAVAASAEHGSAGRPGTTRAAANQRGPAATDGAGGSSRVASGSPSSGDVAQAGTPSPAGSSGDGTRAASPPARAGAEPGRDYVDEIARVLRAPVSDLPDGWSDLPAVVGFPTLRFPSGAIRGGRRLQVTFEVESSSPQAMYLELDGVLLEDGTNILQERASVIVPSGGRRDLVATLSVPESTEPGQQELAVDLTFAAGMRASPSRGTIRIDYTGRPGVAAGVMGRARSGGAALLFVLLGVAGVGLVALVAWGLRSRVDLGSWARGVSYRESSYAREKADGHPLVEMVVTMQNSHIGHRNVHSIRPGISRGVGGGRSPYLIYFVPVPPDMAYVTFDEKTYTFVPVRNELFPELSGPVTDCLGREIPAVSPRGYPITIVFRRFRSPLEELNGLLTSIRVDDRV